MRLLTAIRSFGTQSQINSHALIKTDTLEILWTVPNFTGMKAISVFHPNLFVMLFVI